MMGTIRHAGGVQMCVGLQVLDYRHLLIALLVMMTTISGVATDSRIFNQFEADALNAILKNWTELNPQLSSILKWSPDQHPCNSSDLIYSGVAFEGAWRGVLCTPTLQVANATGFYYEVSVTSIQLDGSNFSCSASDYSLCGFEGIKGVLPSEIGSLTNLAFLQISDCPELTGPVPVEIWQMPNLGGIYLFNNSLIGTLPDPNVFNASSKLQSIYLRNNNFSGNLKVSSQGTLFTSALNYLDVSSNQLEGPVDIFNANNPNLFYLDLSNNRFNGTFSTGPYFNSDVLFLSNNEFTSIKFANFTPDAPSRALGTVYMPTLYNLTVNDNKLSGPFPHEVMQMPSLQYLDLSGNKLSGTVVFRAMANSWNNLEVLNLSRNNFSGSMDFRDIDSTSQLTNLIISDNYFNETFFTSSYLNLQQMDLSNNYFKNIIFDFYNGTTPHAHNNYMPSLNQLYIQNNKLSGEFPAQILTAPTLQVLNSNWNQYDGTLHLPDIPFGNSSLSMILLANNNFDTITCPSNTGPFSTSVLQVSNLLFLGGNPICKVIDSVLLSTICRINQSYPILEVVSKSDTKNKVIIATSTSTAFILVVLVTALYVWRLIGRIKSLNIILEEFKKKDVQLNLYSYKEIKLATNNFDKSNKLGEGAFGVVYKGELFNGTKVAVKKLTMSSNQVLFEFLNEVVIISGLKHRNLVKLKGCCLGDGGQRMLVLEYVENKNLAEALWIQAPSIKSSKFTCMDWPTRFNIIVGIARGLAYLHEDLQSPIIHRDIKGSNILLDTNYNPKIADFGLAYLFPTIENDDASHLTLMQVAGTRGYCSPEYALHGHVSTALDVYSFGILALEVVSGRKSIDISKAEEEVYLREWAWRQFEEQSPMTLIDSKMQRSSTDLEAIMRVISVALTCVHFKAAKRPKMHDVVPMLLDNMPFNNLSGRFEHEEGLEGVVSNFSITSNTTSSWRDENIHIDENSLLSKARDIEMNKMA